MIDSPPRRKTLWITPAYLEWILSGQKTIEVRVAYANLTGLSAGDVLLLNERHSYRIARLSIYSDFEDLLT